MAKDTPVKERVKQSANTVEAFVQISKIEKHSSLVPTKEETRTNISVDGMQITIAMYVYTSREL